MKKILDNFNQRYIPSTALLIYKCSDNHGDGYIEKYDIGPTGRPINARPLTLDEARELAESLHPDDLENIAFLRPKGLMPDCILHVDPLPNQEVVIWYTPPQLEAELYFSDFLAIPSGKAYLPGLIWKATRSNLRVFATAVKSRPTAKTPLFYAPFFNLDNLGTVCMGSVDTEIAAKASINDFIKSWQHFFFNSYFSHLMSGHTPLTVNVVQFWQGHINSGRYFPTDILVKSKFTLETIAR